jgi:hypothetical protein
VRYLLAFVLLGCGASTTPGASDGAVADGAVADGTVADAGIAGRPGEPRETVTGAGRLTGAGYTLDVQVGNPVRQSPTSGAGGTLEGNAPVKPKR